MVINNVMCNEHDLEKLIKNKAKEYYENNILGKTLNTVLYENSAKIILKLTKILISCQIMVLSLNLLKENNKNLYKKEEQVVLKDTILAIAEIKNEIEKLIIPIVEGFEN